MEWEGRRQSTNIEDRRGMSRGAKIGGIGGIGGIIVVLIGMFLGVDLSGIVGGLGVSQSPQGGYAQGTGQLTPQEETAKAMVATVLADNEDTWNTIFKSLGKTYEEPVLVLFSDGVQSACGAAETSSGPFYCPGDHKVYLDLAFFAELAQRFQAPGDLAQAYVVAHEVGHHVQNILGILPKIDDMRKRSDEATSNRLSVMIELQADCFAGVWINRTQQRTKFLQQGDIGEAMNAASAVGDDRIQKKAQGYIVPDSFTHGSSAERQKWLTTGLQSGDINSCNTFAGT